MIGGQLYNWYSYTNNNLLGESDPTGFDPIPLKKIKVEGIAINYFEIDTPDLFQLNLSLDSLFSSTPNILNGTHGGPRNPNPKQNPTQKNQSKNKSKIPKQHNPCNQNLLNLYNLEFNLGTKAQVAAAAGFMLAGASSEAPPVAGALGAASALVGGIGIGMQLVGGYDIYMTTGNLTPLENSSLGIAIGYTSEVLNIPQPANGVGNIAVGEALGKSNATCPL